MYILLIVNIILTMKRFYIKHDLKSELSQQKRKETRWSNYDQVDLKSEQSQ